jgi:hypothetical protein
VILETYTRVYVDSDSIEDAIAFYKALLSGEESLRFRYPETGLELAAVSSPRLSVLIIAGRPEKRAPFEATRLTVKVDALEPFVEGPEASRSRAARAGSADAGRAEDPLPAQGWTGRRVCRPHIPGRLLRPLPAPDLPARTPLSLCSFRRYKRQLRKIGAITPHVARE